MWSKLVHLTLQGLDFGGQRLHLQGLGCNGLGLFSDEVFDLFDIVLGNGSWGSGGFGSRGRWGRDLRQLVCGAVGVDAGNEETYSSGGLRLGLNLLRSQRAADPW